MKRKIRYGRLPQFARALALALTASLLLASCQQTAATTTTQEKSSTDSAATTAAGKNTENTESKAAPADDEVKRIGVVQFAQHASLDNCYYGLLEGLKEHGYVEGENLEVDYQNANADGGLNNTICQNFVSRGYDLIVGIATPSAMAAYNAARDEDIPVVFSAVTDPIEAQLQNADGTNVKGVTGTSDVLPIDEQLQMIRAFQPDAKTLGILYSTSETSSIASVRLYEEKAAAHGFTLVAEGVSESANVPAAALKIVNEVDALTNILDNMIVQNMPVIVERAKEAGLPYYGSEEEQVARGCLATQGLDYLALGAQTGAMAARILNGEAAESIPISQIEKASGFYNSTVMAELGLELPADFADMKDLAKP
ncbi:MAG: ABC transporter substrate-binding protein [Bacillota bacterium]|nr:ABC transporter substrate-binding protein [Bacillota bacterium]